MTAHTVSGTAAAQEQLWSRRADDWARVQEGQMRSAFETCHAIGIARGTRLLDAGCGSGLALRLAADRGAEVTGLDATEALLAHTRRRLPGARCVHGELEQLPFADGEFDVVTGFNSFQYAARPVAAVQEGAPRHAPRRSRARARVGPRGHLRGRAVHGRARLADAPAAARRPRSVRALRRGCARGAARRRGLESISIADVPAPSELPDEETAIRGLLSSGPAVQAIEHAGEQAARDAVRAVIAPHRDAQGGYRLEHVPLRDRHHAAVREHYAISCSETSQRRLRSPAS